MLTRTLREEKRHNMKADDEHTRIIIVTAYVSKVIYVQNNSN